MIQTNVLPRGPTSAARRSRASRPAPGSAGAPLGGYVNGLHIYIYIYIYIYVYIYVHIYIYIYIYT